MTTKVPWIAARNFPHSCSGLLCGISTIRSAAQASANANRLGTLKIGGTHLLAQSQPSLALTVGWTEEMNGN